MIAQSLLAALLAVSLSAAAPQMTTSEIVGGEPASQGDFPFIVSLSRSGSHFCGGSLLNSNTVLTAAHCAQGQTASNLRVRAGSLNRNSGGVVVGVSSIRIHPSYSSSTLNNDVAILKLSSSISQSSTIGYASLAAAGSDPVAGVTHTVAGWGRTSSGGSSPSTLQQVDVPVVSRTTCRQNYSQSEVTDNMWCAGFSQGGKDACQGDSGGPIIDKSTRVLTGVVSWGEGCAAANKPGVYARIGSTRTFINNNL